MLDLWRRFQEQVWWRRVPLKGAILLGTIFVVCFPYPNVFLRHIQHWRDPNALIDPESLALRPLIAELKPKLEGIEPGPEALKVVERFVLEKVPYAWDWDTWGVADYFPTVDEALAAGQEDCDGRAIVSASLLRNFGYQAELVTDLAHVWVKTDRGETMGPGPMGKAIETKGGKVRIHWDALANIPRSLAYGLAVFPVSRELMVLGVYVVLAMRRRMSRWSILAGVVFLLDGLFLLRIAGANAWQADVTGQMIGLANLLIGVLVLHAAHVRARRMYGPALQTVAASVP